MRRSLFTLFAAVLSLSCVPAEKPDSTAAELRDLRADIRALGAEVKALRDELAASRAREQRALDEEAQKRAREMAEAAERLQAELSSAKDDATKKALQEQLRLEQERRAEQARAQAKCKPGFTADASGRCRVTPATVPKPPCACVPGDPLCTCM